MQNRLLIIAITLLFFSCGKEKIIQLPEIQNAKITEILDVSPAYIFYDETKQDSVELNRKNLIISTNWLVNVDKRLTLEQALPKIKFLQDKKRNASLHKNERARNYYTCNDTSIKNLGFLDFTDVFYHKGSYSDYSRKTSTIDTIPKAYLNIVNSNKIEIFKDTSFSNRVIANKKNLIKQIINTQSLDLKEKFILSFNKELTFQDYITIKSKLSDIKLESISFSDNEFIY
ncbi:hypothetical protein [Olleya sp. R77988]|uniref:hypothetical protein n=1 Tax=Olleya sp. R77988 TaxID=3093875 RepID=UPI0037CCA369